MWPEIGQQVCGGWWCKPSLVYGFGLDQADQQSGHSFGGHPVVETC